MESLLKVPLSVGVRRLFYVVSPNETSYETIEEVPKFVSESIPFFVLAILLETLILHSRFNTSAKLPSAMDTLSSLCAGMFSQIPLIVVRGAELTTYIWVYNSVRIYELPWESAWTWVLCMLGVDHGYYWVHRMAHEVNFMWAGHQVHHSSEFYNLSTALRQSAVQRYTSWIFYLPLALFIPPSVFLVHVQFNLIYQFWVHTELVGNLGILEYVFVTPSQHRVHHGRNRYCIDTNYGGFLSIWDRLYGTLVEEEDEVQYGLVHPLNSWDNLYTQLGHWHYLLTSMFSCTSVSHFVKHFAFGPGWQLGKPRLGHITDIPNIKAPLPVYNKTACWYRITYNFTHFFLTVLAVMKVEQNKQRFSYGELLICSAFLLWSLSSIGYLSELKRWATAVESIRCAVYIYADIYTQGMISLYLPPYYAVTIYYVSFFLSATSAFRKFVLN